MGDIHKRFNIYFNLRHRRSRWQNGINNMQRHNGYFFKTENPYIILQIKKRHSKHKHKERYIKKSQIDTSYRSCWEKKQKIVFNITRGKKDITLSGVITGLIYEKSTEFDIFKNKKITINLELSTHPQLFKTECENKDVFRQKC